MKNVEFKKMPVTNSRGNRDSNINFCMTIFGKKEITAQKSNFYFYFTLYVGCNIHTLIVCSIISLSFSFKIHSNISINIDEYRELRLSFSIKNVLYLHYLLCQSALNEQW